MDFPTVRPVTCVNGKAVFPLKEAVLPHRKYRQLLHRRYIKNASLNMRFSKDVINCTMFYRVPFKERDGSNMFDLFEVVAPREVKDQPPSRPSRLKQLPRRQLKQEAEAQEGMLGKGHSERRPSHGRRHKVPTLTVADSSSESRSPKSQTSQVQVAEQGAEQWESPPKKPAEDSSVPQREQWDEYLVKKLSKRTAQWLVTKQMPKGPSRVRLNKLLQDHYGSAHAHALVQDETMTDGDFDLYEQIKVQEPSIVVVRKVTKTPLAAYYRVPGFHLNEDILDEPGAVNQTAANLTVKHFELPPKPKTVLNTKLGKHVYYTENVFEQELYAGSSSIVYHHGEKYKERIIMDNLSEYQKHLQERYPPMPVEWTEDKEDQDKRKIPEGSKRISKGLRRWTALPTLADYTAEQGLKLPDYDLVEKKVKRSLKTREELQVMRNMVTGWIKAWHIYIHWQNITVEELKRDLKTIHSNVQLNALVTCACGAIERPKLEQDDDLINLHLRYEDEVQAVPEALQPLISEALNSSNKLVQLAAAICHVAMEKVNARVTEILQDILLHGNIADRWIAAQSLALNGDDSYPVVNRIIQHFFEAPEEETLNQVCLILGPLSERTTLVQFILAKYLNSRNWKEKVLACKVLSCLRGSLNKDLIQKIVYLMWNDWNSNVRQAATHSLGALGLGKEAHDVLRKRLEEGDCRTRIEALSCIGQLGLMTGNLMPSFLKCFDDDFIGVRREACLTAGLLRIKDEKVLDHLVRLVQSDYIWKVRAYAIKALGDIGRVTEQLKDLLLWALHYEQQPGIRLEACKSIVALNLRDANIQNVLREQLLVDPHPLVRKDVRLALEKLGGSSEVEEGMLPKIRKQIKMLCQKDIVIWKLLRLEMVQMNVTQQLERINLQKQPEHLATLTERIEQLNKSLTAPSFPSTPDKVEDLKECEAEIQSVLDSSTPAGSQVTEQNLSVRCHRNGEEWQTVSGEELQYSRALREGSCRHRVTPAN
ncbi:HEAT repeat-containing protein 4 [Scyliorhinus torazame]